MSVAQEDVRAQIERVVRSRTFETSEVHRRLLLYLSEKTLAGEAERLKEYTIGLEAFGKPSSYDPKHDSIVRLQVGRLRQKLMAYYQTEAAENEIQIGLPKGAFKLIFSSAEEPPPANGFHPAVDRSWKRWLLPVGLAVSVIWAIVASVLLLGERQHTEITAERWSPELEALWAPFLHSERSLLVCLGTPMFVRFPGYGFFRDPKTNDWQEIASSNRIGALRKSLGDSQIAPAYAFTGAGEASAAFLIAKLLSSRKRELYLTRSSILSWQQISDHDVVFIGPPKFNQQLQAAALTQDIVIEPEGIRNLKPRAGEPSFLEDRIVAGKPQEGETHALISRTPGLSGVGDLLVIAGNASPDTLAAAEWLTQAARARELAERLRSSSGDIPRYFQAVIKVSFQQGIPVQSSYVFHHALQENRAAGKKP